MTVEEIPPLAEGECPCCSGKQFDACCGPLLAGEPAPTAEALMRSRYTAYTKADIDYIMRTMAPDASTNDFVPEEAREIASNTIWGGLRMLNVKDGGPEDESGEVEYVARYKHDGRQLYHHERTTFGRNSDGHWWVLGGVTNPRGDPRKVMKIGRNDPCPCGSGKKFKKCCGSVVALAKAGLLPSGAGKGGDKVGDHGGDAA